MAESELKRVLKLPAVAFIAIGFTIGGGVFVFTGIVFKITGQALPVAYALAVIPVFISMLPIAMLGSAIPTTGANYKYPSRMVSPGLAFTGIWVYGVASFVGQIPLYALGCAKYLQVYFPDLSAPMAAMGILTFIFIINLLGVKLAAQIQGVFVVILITALLYYSGSGLAIIEPQNFSNPFEKGLPNLLLGTALLTFTYVGTNGIIELGGEIINPRKVIPTAFFIPIQIASIRLPKLYPDHYHNAGFKLKGFWLWFCPMVGILMVVFFSIIILYDLNSPLKVGSFLGFIITGLVYYLFRKKYLRSKGIHLENLKKNESTWDV